MFVCGIGYPRIYMCWYLLDGQSLYSYLYFYTYVYILEIFHNSK